MIFAGGRGGGNNKSRVKYLPLLSVCMSVCLSSVCLSVRQPICYLRSLNSRKDFCEIEENWKKITFWLTLRAILSTLEASNEKKL